MPDVITSADQWIEMNKRKDLDMRDLELVRAACRSCVEVGGMVSITRNARYGRTEQEDVRVMGITENMSRIGSVRDLIAGRNLVGDEVDAARPVAVIGADLMDAFFGQTEPLGKEILIDNRAFRVVGVAERKGSIFGESQDNFAWIPITYFRKIYGTRRSVTVQAEAESMAAFEQAQDQARVAMRVRRHLAYEDPDDFSVETGESVLDLWQSFTRGIYAATLLVTIISLIVGGWWS